MYLQITVDRLYSMSGVDCLEAAEELLQVLELSSLDFVDNLEKSLLVNTPRIFMDLPNGSSRIQAMKNVNVRFEFASTGRIEFVRLFLYISG